MGSASGLRDGNQAKKAQRFTVSVFGSHAVPGSAKTDSFCLRLFWVPRPHPVFQVLWQVQRTGIVTRWMVLLWSALPPL